MAREMKDSGIEWIGEIPTAWNSIPNKYVMRKKKVIQQIYKGQDILSLTMNGVIVRDLDAGGKMPSSFDGYQKLTPGNLLMCLFDYDVTPRCIGIIKNKGVTSPAYSQFVIKNKNSTNYFYYYYLMVDEGKYILPLAKNLRHSFTEEQLGMIKVPVPPIDEQINIATFLDSKCSQIDSLVADITKEIELLKEYRKSVIYEAVTKGLDPNVELKDSNVTWIGKIPKNWSLIPLKYCFVIENGSDPITSEGDVPVYGSGSNSFKTCKEYKTGPTVLLGRKGTVNIPQWVEGRYWNVDTAFNTILKGNYDFRLFYYVACCFDYDNYSTQTALPSMTQTTYYNFLLPKMDDLEQQQIVSYLDSKCAEIDALVASKQQQIEKLGEYKKSLIYEYVTGKKEVPAV